jgi:hypothetical protein
MTTLGGRVVAGTLLALVGLVWIGQGLGLLRGSSFMVDDVRWAIAGVVAAIVGVVLVVNGRRRSP